MFYCVHCGARIADNELDSGWEPHGEEWKSCPRCGHTDLDEMIKCKRCGYDYLEEELTEGLCDDCLDQMVTFERFKRFGLEGASETEVSIFEEYVWEWHFGFGTLAKSDTILKEMISKAYDENVKWEYSELENISHFVLKYYKDEWAEFCAEEVRRCTRDETAENTSA